MIDNLRVFGKRKIHHLMKIKFVSVTDLNNKCLVYFKSTKIEIIIGFLTEIIEKLFDTLLDNYKVGLEHEVKGSNIVYNDIQELCSITQ